MKILDLSAGKRAIWFDKNYRDTVYCDVRPEVNPTLVCDSRSLPPEIGADYDLVVFDPPHANLGANGNMTELYGKHTCPEIRALVADTAREAHRVARCDALMAFKWNDHDLKLSTILALLTPYWEPLFGHQVSMRTPRCNQTQWVMLRRRSA